MQKNELNKQEKFGVKILWRYTDMAIFVLRCFILTHPVDNRYGPGTGVPRYDNAQSKPYVVHSLRANTNNDV